MPLYFGHRSIFRPGWRVRKSARSSIARKICKLAQKNPRQRRQAPSGVARNMLRAASRARVCVSGLRLLAQGLQNQWSRTENSTANECGWPPTVGTNSEQPGSAPIRNRDATKGQSCACHNQKPHRHGYLSRSAFANLRALTADFTALRLSAHLGVLLLKLPRQLA